MTSPFTSKWLTALAVGALVLTPCASAFAGFNFAYRAVGEADLQPVQVFDDGQQTFIQMKGGVVPAVFVMNGGQETMVNVGRQGQLLVVDAIATDLVARFGNLSSRISYIGQDRARTTLGKKGVMKEPVAVAPSKLARSVNVSPPNYGATKPLIGDEAANGTPDFIDREALVPFAKGKQQLSKDAAAKILVALAGSGSVAKVVITGRDDQQYVEGLARSRAIAIRDRILAAGVPLDRVVMKEGIARDGEGSTVTSDLVVTWKTRQERTAADYAAAAGSRFRMARSDGSISSMVSRWAALEGWSVIWRSSDDPPIAGDSSVNANSFIEAVEIVLGQSRQVGYTMQIQQTVNKTLVVQ